MFFIISSDEEGGGGGGRGLVQEHESPKKNSKLEFKVFFEVLKFTSLFST
jgi:acetylornithine deacetylase/succinyl-diaminopimelate desuccinylase-like protein